MSKFSLDRRQFALGAAAAATALVLPINVLPIKALPIKALPGNALPMDAVSEPVLPANLPATAGEDSNDDRIRAAMSKLSPAAQKEVEMKVDSIFRKYGGRLDDDQKSDIRRIMAETQDGLEKMRAFKLENGDQPADSFAAYRAGSPSHEVKAHAAKGGAAKAGEKK
jgi:hypothetical protein